mmetsp:Transcript_2888/g.6216  ORF Transcript_2888/g.6216 Transcript_2888/m.6216 type:complete len:85 (+) Transcript_2888:239-493(+)
MSIKAGIDMVMVPYNYQLFTSNLLDLVNSGAVSVDLINQAVSRILTAKFELGLFENPYPDTTYIGDIGSEPHMHMARAPSLRFC